MTRGAAFVLVLLTGCVGIQSALGHPPCDPSGNATPAVSPSQLRAAWVARYGALPSPRCDAPWSWSVISADDLARTCGKSLVNGTWKDANACTVYGIGDNGTRDPGCPASYTWSKYAQSRELNTHEYAHWALRCSTGDGDMTHTHRLDVWGAGGFDGSFGP